MNSAKLSIRPYARLLTMLGDQLISNERTALVELIKNSYDADADWVDVRFENFNDDDSANENSRIVVEDNGSGMSPEVIRDSWMNPAAPHKFIQKKEGETQTPGKGRIIQGEKGIGRFAILKLGSVITVMTRTDKSPFESVLKYDFAKFDDDFTEENEKAKEMFLDQIEIDYSESSPPEAINTTSGTAIQIRKLKGTWSKRIIDELLMDVASLTDPVSRLSHVAAADDFKISIFCNGKQRSPQNESAERLKALIEDSAVLKIEGEFNSEKNAFIFSDGGDESSKQEIKLNDSKIKGLWTWRQHFRGEINEKQDRDYKCGSFKFHFYIFDFSRNRSGKHALNQKQKNLLKEHRIYLYRDAVRVFPYGNSNDDWLEIDIRRGTGRAGHFFSNDQIIGWVDISQKDNPDLRDKTNREGLIQKGEATADFLFLIPTFLSYVKQYPYSRYQQKLRTRNVVAAVRANVVFSLLADLKNNLKEKGHTAEAKKIVKIEMEYKRERDYLVQRAETTEDLAGVGLSVETTSHDIMLMMSRARDLGIELAKLLQASGDEKIRRKAETLVETLTQITEGMTDIQSLFKSAKRRRKSLKIEPVLDKIYHLYEGLLEKRGIQYEKFIATGSPLVASTTDGVVMQVLINLFDNAAYWLDTVERREKKISVAVNGTRSELVFSDNGPGIDEKDAPYVFEPFYSGKGQEGRGLGLYIARQLLERHDYRISIAEDHQKNLQGANFVVRFVNEDS